MPVQKLLLFPVVLLAACASTQASRSVSASSAGVEQPGLDTQVVQAAVTPFNDINLVQTRIPRVLTLAAKAPYAPPVDPACAALVAEVEALDAVLGADLDAAKAPTDPDLVARGTDAAGEAVVGLVQGTATDFVPFRSWVRKFSGAERHARKAAAAIEAGVVRRAYLKGLGQAAGCPVPAAPRT